MPITFNEKNRVFKLDAGNSTYAFLIEPNGYIAHLCYGGKIDSDALEYLYRPMDRAFSPAAPGTQAPESRDVIPQEFGTNGIGDFHAPGVIVRQENGHTVTDFKYRSHKIYKGKPALEGLPATFGADGEVDTLELSLHDAASDVEFILLYSTFTKYNAIARAAKVVNRSGETVRIEKLSSASVDFPGADFELLHLPGAWGRERAVERRKLSHTRTVIESVRGLSSHQQNPFFALAAPQTTETAGEAYGITLLYSGNFAAELELDQFNLLRAQIGINERTFEWVLAPGESFTAPEALLVYSADGLGDMSRTFHNLFHDHLIRSYWKDRKRPILVNNWEATYFNFNEEKLLAIAKDAADLGIEMLVLDDGWFGKRDDDTNSLGDWVADRRKLPGGIDALAKKVTELGMKFGLWFEPEMVSEDSDLYRAHPDWCIHVEGRRRTPSRHQLVLDLSRNDVCDYIVDAVSKVLGSAPISYVKWDMNRNITEIGSAKLPAERQQELPHRYMLGLYSVLERLTGMFPDVLFEGCSGGGGRFDAGMLPYFPQYWTSDDTDAIERLYIQHGTSMVMPSCTMGAHVSAVPNHQIGRTTSMKTRGNVAMMGQFGYELDLSTLSGEDIAEVRNQIETYKKIRTTVHRGDMYRLRSPFEGRNTAWEYVAEDKSRVVLMYCTIMGKVQAELTRVRFEGLDADAKYRDTETGTVYDADFLMNRGLFFDDNHDFESRLMIFERV